MEKYCAGFVVLRTQSSLWLLIEKRVSIDTPRCGFGGLSGTAEESHRREFDNLLKLEEQNEGARSGPSNWPSSLQDTFENLLLQSYTLRDMLAKCNTPVQNVSPANEIRADYFPRHALKLKHTRKKRKTDPGGSFAMQLLKVSLLVV